MNRRHDTLWTLYFIRTGESLHYRSREDCNIDAFYYGDASPIAVYSPIYTQDG